MKACMYKIDKTMFGITAGLDLCPRRTLLSVIYSYPYETASASPCSRRVTLCGGL